MKKIFLFTLITLFALCFSVSAQKSDSKLVGKWAMTDVKVTPEKGGKLSPEQKEMEKMIKKMMQEEGSEGLGMEFKSNGDLVSGKEKKAEATWKTAGNEIHKTDKSSGKVEKVRYKLAGKKLEMTILPAENGVFMTMVLEKK